MNPNHLLRRLTVLAAVALAAAVLVMGCTHEPDETVFANPFDPATPGSGDPFGLTATYLGNQVRLEWTHLDGFDIVNYIVQRYTTASGWTAVATEVPITGSTVSLIDEDPDPTIANSYQVIAVDGDGNSPGTSHLVPATVMVPPLITNAADTTAVFTRIQDLVVHAGEANQVELDTTEAFTSAMIVPVDAGVAAFEGYDLGAAEESGVSKPVYARAVFGEGDSSFYSAVGQRTFKVRFAPDIALPDRGLLVSSQQIDLAVENQAEGVTRMRFALSLGALDAEPWIPAARILEDFMLDDQVNAQTVYADFEGDWGYVHRDSLTVTPATLDDADFTLPDGSTVAGPVLRVESAAVGATEMRIALAEDWDAAPWESLVETLDFTLPDDLEPGIHVLNVRYRNPWHESPLRSALLTIGGTDVQVAFSFPVEGAVVQGGTGLDLVGYALGAPAGDPVHRVEVELQGVWQEAVGTASWETFWDIPLVAEDQDVTVRARAFLLSGVESATALLTVTVSNLRVAITAPTAASIVSSGELTVIMGTAGPYLAGAPLDSVVVTIADQRLRADEPLTDWMLEWTAPTVTEATAVGLTAWAFAGGDSVSHAVEVSVEPAEE